MWLSLWVTAALALATPVLAQGGAPSESEQLDAARALANAGFKLFEQGDYATAFDRFRRAEEIYHAPPHLLFMARAQVQLGKLVEAQQLYEQLAAETLRANIPPPFREAQDSAKSELEALHPRVPSLQITLVDVPAGGGSVTIDGQPIADEALAAPVAVNPGERLLLLEVPGHEASEATVTVEEGTKAHPVELAPGPALREGGAIDPLPGGDDGAAPSIVPPLVVLGVGVAGLGVGVITGILTLNDASELKDRCPQNPCPAEHESLADSVNTLGTVSTVGFIVGGAAVAAGALWLLLQPGAEGGESEQEARRRPVELLLGPGFVGLEGTF